MLLRRDKMSEETKLKEEIKKIIIEVANLEEMTADDIGDDTPLFGEELGLDSIDALEIGVAVRKHFGITFDDIEENNKKHFYSVNTLAKYIKENQKK